MQPAYTYLSDPISSYPISSHPIPPHATPCHPMPPYPTQSHSIPSNPTSSHPIPFRLRPAFLFPRTVHLAPHPSITGSPCVGPRASPASPYTKTRHRAQPQLHRAHVPKPERRVHWRHCALDQVEAYRADSCQDIHTGEVAAGHRDYRALNPNP